MRESHLAFSFPRRGEGEVNRSLYFDFRASISGVRFPMPSWQSTFFRRFSRRSRPRAPDAATDIAELRRHYTHLFERFGAAPGGVAFEAGQLGPVKGEWVKLGAASSDRLILYFHGGGYIAGSPQTHRPLIARLCQASEANAFVPAYRVAPDLVFPAAVRDGIDAYRHLISKRIDPLSIVLAGDGAGGGLAFAVLLAIPFVLGSLRSAGSGARALVGLMLGIGFFLLQRLIESGTIVFQLDPVVLAWLPTALLAMVALGLLWRTR